MEHGTVLIWPQDEPDSQEELVKSRAMTTTPSDSDHTFDYIVCGGGTSGCVVAARLAEQPGVTVLMIEAGSDNKDLENCQMVGGWNALFDGPTDWNIESEPNQSINGRKIKLSRGKFLGGTSGLNGTLCIRGSRQDYDDWELEGWGGDEFFKYMMKSETFHPTEWFEASREDHGSSGPLNTEPRELAPISKLFMESFESQGFPYDADMFSHGRNPYGFGHITRTHFQGYRSMSTAYLSDQASLHGSLRVVTNATVDRVLFDHGPDKLRATAVDVINDDDSKWTFRARREIILSAGSYCTPTILMRSGIGAREELDQAGIPCLLDLPGVGKNLMDHLIVFILYETEKQDLTTDNLIYQKNGYDIARNLWREKKTGFLSSSPFGVGAFARLDERLKDSPEWANAPRQPGRDPMGLTTKQPNVEFFTTECYGGLKKLSEFPEGKQAFGIVAELFSPRSRGAVTITSSDPKQKPRVDHNYLADSLDVLVLADACQLGHEIVTKGAGTADIVKGSWPKEAAHHARTTRDSWAEYARENAVSGFHAAGTCKMGKPDDPTSVLDHKLRVLGVENLRVADCSVMPLLNGGHTQMPAYGIGEKAADLIKSN